LPCLAARLRCACPFPSEVFGVQLLILFSYSGMIRKWARISAKNLSHPPHTRSLADRLTDEQSHTDAQARMQAKTKQLQIFDRPSIHRKHARFSLFCKYNFVNKRNSEFVLSLYSSLINVYSLRWRWPQWSGRRRRLRFCPPSTRSPTPPPRAPLPPAAWQQRPGAFWTLFESANILGRVF